MFFSRKNKQRQSLPTFSFCESGARGLRAWVSVLPRKDSMALAKQLVQAGSELRASKVTLGHMIELMEVLAEPIASAAEGLLQLRGKNERQIDIYRKRREFFNLFGQLYFLMAKKQQGSNTHLHSEQLLLKASDFLSEAVIASHNLYQLPPVDCWRALHAIFHYSVSDAHSEAHVLKLSAAYKTVVALTCANPEKLCNAQIESLTELIRTALAGFRVCSEPNDTTYYAVKLCSNDPPSRLLSNVVDKEMIYFDFSVMEAMLSQTSLSPELSTHLQLSYGPSVARSFPRHLPNLACADTSHEVLETCLDFSALHYYFCGEVGFEEYIDRYHRSTKANLRIGNRGVASRLFDMSNGKVNLNSSDINPRHSCKYDDAWSGIYSTNWQSLGSTGDAIESQLTYPDNKSPYNKSPDNNSQDNTCQDNTRVEPKREFPVQRLSIKDLNAQGYCLTGSASILKQYKTGSVVGVKNPNQLQWHLAIIRWSKTGDNKKTLGVELLGPNIQACAIKIIHSTHGTEFLPAFLLPGDAVAGSESSGQPSILTPRLALKSKASAVVIIVDTRQKVLLGECVEQSTSFCRYSYSVLAAEQEKTVSAVPTPAFFRRERYYE